MKRSGCNHLLFPDVKAKDRCFDKQCFDKKTAIAFTKKLKEIIETKPDIHLLHSRYRDSNKEAMAYAKEMKLKVLSDNEDFQDQSYSQYKKKAQGFWLNGWNQGEIKTIYLKGVATVDKNGKKVAAPEKSAKEQIIDIQSREKRAKELDEVKIWTQLYPEFKPEKYSGQSPFIQAERNAIARAMFNKLGFNVSDKFNKMLGIDGRKDKWPDISEGQLNQICRFFMMNVLPPTPTTLYSGYNTDVNVCLPIARIYFGPVLNKLETDQKAIAEKRAGRVKKRIADLQPKKSINKPKK